MSNGPSFLELFGPEPIYQAGLTIALWVFSTATPVLLIMAIAIRVLETQIDLLAGQGRFTVAVRDFFIYGFAISVYFGLMNLIASFMNPFYHWIDSFGSLKAVAGEMATLSETIKQQNGNESALNQLTSIAVSPSVWIVQLVCYVTYILLSALTAFLRIAHAIGYSLAVIYGLIALPLSITTSLRLLRGWGLFMGFLLLWPIVEGICVGLFSQVFTHAASLMIHIPNQSAGMSAFDLNIFYAGLNILLMCVLIAAAWVSGYLVMNTSPHSGLVAPFVAGAAAMGGVLSSRVFGGAHRAGSHGAGGGSAQGIPGSAISQIARDFKARVMPSPAHGDANASHRPADHSQMPSLATAGGVTTPSQGTASSGNEDASDSSQRRQQRRGAIIQQQRKAKTE